MSGTYLTNLLGDKEEVLLVTRQHWFMLIRNIVLELVLITVIIVVSVLVSIFLPGIGALAYLGLFLLVIPLVGLIHDVMVWYNYQYILTNRRVIQTKGIINKNTADSSLEKVNDVKLSQSFWGRLFNYGTIQILTASELGVNTFHYIGSPIKFKTAMENAKENLTDLEDTPFANDAVKETNIPILIAELDQLRNKGILSEDEFQKKKNDLLSRM